MPRLPSLAAILLVVLAPAASHAQPAAPSGGCLPGVVLETMDAGTAPDRTGLESGDLLLAWQRASGAGSQQRGSFTSPFELYRFLRNVAPRGAYSLTVERDGRRLTLSGKAGLWTDITVRPHLAGWAKTAYDDGLRLVGQTYPGEVTLLLGLVKGRLLVAGTRIDRVDLQKGLQLWRDLAAALHASGESAAAAWVQWRVSWELVNASPRGPEKPGSPPPLASLDDARAALDEAASNYARALGPAAQILLRELYAHELIRTGKAFPEALTILEAAVVARQRLGAGSLDEAVILAELAQVQRMVDGSTGEEPSAATGKQIEAALARAIAIYRQHAPDSVELARALASLGEFLLLKFEVGNSEPRRYLRRAWRLVQASAPLGSEAVEIGHFYSLDLQLRGELVAHARTLRRIVQAADGYCRLCPTFSTQLAELSRSLVRIGELEDADGFAVQSLTALAELDKRTAGLMRPRAPIMSIGPLTLRADIARIRGDLAVAEQRYSEALALSRQRAPDRTPAPLGMGLATIFELRGDIAGAEALFRAITKDGISNNNIPAFTRLARLETAAGRLDAAEALAKLADEYATRVMPGSMEHAEVKSVLGEIAERRGDRASMDQYAREALGLLESSAPGTLALASAQERVGDLARGRDNWGEAERSYRSALTIRRRLVPVSVLEARTLHRLALVHRAQGRTNLAVVDYQRALVALEGQIGRVGSSPEAQAGLSATSAAPYRDYVELLVDLGQPAEAFHVLERSRARALAVALSQRRLGASAGVSPTLTSERSQVEVAYDQAQQIIASADPTKDAPRIERLLTELRLLRSRMHAIDARINATSPRAGIPRPSGALTAAQVQAELEPGTLLLSYLVATSRTLVFVVGRTNALSVVSIPRSRADLTRDVTAFRTLVQSSTTPVESIVERGLRLFEHLLGPAANTLDGAQRLLIVGDGPLLTLPFSALTRPAPDGRRQFLVEWKPTHFAASATTYVTMSQPTRRQTGEGVSLVAFGDPTLPRRTPSKAGERMRAGDPASSEEIDAAARDEDPELNVELDRSAALAPLPATRGEVTRIVALYGQNARAFLGPEATEDRAKALGPSARVLHFATHGLTNDRLPLNSGLLFSPTTDPRKGNGLLQAWEIYDGLRLDADLVTLSACETALGDETPGEGLLSLTRAFQVAGARTVVATLWKIADTSTATLMAEFYRGLKAGLSKDASLQSAQRALQSGHEGAGRWIHPFYWAGFQAYGTPR